MTFSHPHRKKLPLTIRIISEIVWEIGAILWIEPEYGYAGSIEFANGKKHLFINKSINPNSISSLKIAKDKWYTSMFLEKFWYQVAEGRNFYSEELNDRIDVKRGIEDGWNYALELWLPVIIKPNDLSQWFGVQKVSSRAEYIIGANTILEATDVMRIERLHRGHDYRVVMFDHELISAYMRIPLSVTGDGIHTISELIDIKQGTFIENERDTRIKKDDPRILKKLWEKSYTFETIPEKWEQVALLDNANLSSGWDSLDVTEMIHPDFIDLATHITRDMGLRLCGIDFMTHDITRPLSENPDYIIIELNWSPWLDNYISTGEKQRNIVKNMYKKILLTLAES